MKAKAPLLLSALAVTLSACGTPGSSAPSAADLLRTPTALSLGGHTLSAEAGPLLDGSSLTAQVQVSGLSAPLALNVRSVYLVTQGGIWQAEGRWKSEVACSLCRTAEAHAPAQGLLPGEQVQVVVRLQDGLGQNYWLRDDKAAVQAR